MSKTTYERPRAFRYFTERIFNEVALKWLETGKRKLKRSDVWLICDVCFDGEAATDMYGEEGNGYFIRLLQDNNAEVGELIQLVGQWRAKQDKTKLGRLRQVIEFALMFSAGKELDYDLIETFAKRRGIKFSDISKNYIRGRLDDIRKEVIADYPTDTRSGLLPLAVANGSKQTRKLNGG